MVPAGVEGVGDEVEIVGNHLLLAGVELGAGRRKIDLATRHAAARPWVAAEPSQLPATGHGVGPKYGVCPSSSLQEVVVVARLRVLVGNLAAALILAFAAPASASGGGTAKVRAFHNSPDTPPVDICVNGAKTLPDVPTALSATTSRCPRGPTTLQVKVAPSTAGDPAALEADVRLGKRPTTIAAIGSLTGDGEPLQLKVLRDRDTISRR